MNEKEAKAALNRLFDQLGVKQRSVAIVHSDMNGIPLPKYPTELSRAAMQRLRKKWCEFLFSALRDHLGPAGTLVVPAFTYSTTQPGGKFDLETTPSEVGPFSEFVRQLPDARRSFHPIFSLAAVGPEASKIVDDCGAAAFGHESPWQRLSDIDARIITLGTPFHSPTTYVHHIEQCFGVPHRFHKTLEVPMYRCGAQVEGVWLAYLRYRSMDVGPNLVPLESALRAAGHLAEASWNEKMSSAVNIHDVDAVGYAMLARDPWAFATRRIIMRLDEQVPEAGPTRDTIADLVLRPATSGKAGA